MTIGLIRLSQIRKIVTVQVEETIGKEVSQELRKYLIMILRYRQRLQGTAALRRNILKVWMRRKINDAFS